MNKIKNWLIYNDYLYLIPISLVLILIFSFIYRNKSFKKCMEASMAFLVCVLLHYIFL